MNIGGPAHHVSMLSGRLDRRRFETLLVYGTLGSQEGSFEALAATEGCTVKVLGDLRPEPQPAADLRALRALIGVVRAFRPDIVHTHTAKAGFLGRLAALLSPGPRPVIVHTYHGHVLEGYFGRARTEVYRGLERALAPVSDCLIGVSQATVDDLVRLRVAPRERFRVIPVGLDLNRFVHADPAAAGELRSRCGATSDDLLVACVGRLVPIKRVDLILRATARARRAGVAMRLMVVGDGECRTDLERLAEELGIANAVRFLGYLADTSAAAAAADIAILASDNEGTPVALIESAAAGRPAVATAVGGVPDVVVPGTGLLVAPGDDAALADALSELAGNAELRARMGDHARTHVTRLFSIDRLLGDVEALYESLLSDPASRNAPARQWRRRPRRASTRRGR